MNDDEWKHAVTLEERVIQLFQEKKTKDPEFLVYLEIYGRQRLLDIWEKYKQKKKIKDVE